MRFIETPVFTETLLDTLSDDDYRDLQMALIFRPEQGALIRGSGGLRKIRWRLERQGKRGGIRIIYYWNKSEETFYLLFAYRKTNRKI